MIDCLRPEKYPDLGFSRASDTALLEREGFDAIFSNETLHWVLEKEKDVEVMAQNLYKGGRLVVEFGGRCNVNSLITAWRESLLALGLISNAERKIWYFPSLGEHTTLLEKKGFTVTYAVYFDRETLLRDEGGLKKWLIQFGEVFLNDDITDEQKNEVLYIVEQKLKPTNYKNGNWYAGYRRLRIRSIKG